MKSTRPSLILETPAYDVAFSNFVHDLVTSFAIATQPLLGKMKTGERVLETHPQRISGPKGVAEISPFSHEMRFGLTGSDVLDCQREGLLSELFTQGVSLGEAILKQVLKNVDKTTAVTGNRLDGKSLPNRVERFFAALELVDIQFDEFGEPLWPEMVLSPREHAGLIQELRDYGENAKERLAALAKRKKEAWDASRSTRCLSEILQKRA